MHDASTGDGRRLHCLTSRRIYLVVGVEVPPTHVCIPSYSAIPSGLRNPGVIDNSSLRERPLHSQPLPRHQLRPAVGRQSAELPAFHATTHADYIRRQWPPGTHEGSSMPNDMSTPISRRARESVLQVRTRAGMHDVRMRNPWPHSQ